MLSRWIDQTANFQGIEKAHVEQAVAAMPGVVDLEMGLPASGAQTTALRMDLVALERISSRLNIVFWEAKMIGDGRLRSRTTPEVFSQIEAYVRFLENREHRLQVIEAYRRACKLLINFNEVAQCAFGTPSLDPIVYEAAADGSPLDVDVTPRLMIFDDGMPRNEQAWQCHLDKVKERTTVEFIPVGGFQTVAAI